MLAVAIACVASYGSLNCGMGSPLPSVFVSSCGYVSSVWDYPLLEDTLVDILHVNLVDTPNLKHQSVWSSGVFEYSEFLSLGMSPTPWCGIAIQSHI